MENIQTYENFVFEATVRTLAQDFLSFVEMEKGSSIKSTRKLVRAVELSLHLMMRDGFNPYKLTSGEHAFKFIVSSPEEARKTFGNFGGYDELEKVTVELIHPEKEESLSNRKRRKIFMRDLRLLFRDANLESEFDVEKNYADVYTKGIIQDKHPFHLRRRDVVRLVDIYKEDYVDLFDFVSNVRGTVRFQMKY